MLGLKSKTPAQWVAGVEANLDEVLIDHAHCEKKAAGTAVNLIFSHVDRRDLVLELSAIAREELEHFELVIGVLDRRGVELRRLTPSSYGRRLGELVRAPGEHKLVDRLLIAALIEARSCERFQLLRDGLADRELGQFFGGLFASEARHYATYVRMAETVAPAADVAHRLEQLAIDEARIIADSDGLARIHS